MSSSFMPPNLPWREIDITQPENGYLAFHYSDDLSALPVRAVTMINDNKADPNIETLTYGLLSYCGRPMRSGVLRRGSRYLFFVTRWRGIRVLTGYYSLRWYVKLPDGECDYCLAADADRFVADPIPLAEIAARHRIPVDRRFRIFLKIGANECRILKSLIHRQPDVTNKYLQEIHRLERFNLRYGGYRNISYGEKEKFSWNNPRVERILASLGG
ncbi:hypothetical protein ACFLQR_00420 [Verrucomicrobiota bacterium]